MSTPNLVPRGDLTGSIGTDAKRWLSGSFGRVSGSFYGDGSALTGITATADLEGTNVISQSMENVTLGDGLAVQNVLFDTAFTSSGHVTGHTYWDSTAKTLAVDMEGSEVILQVGQEFHIYARNVSGTTIPNGSVVRVTGATGNKITVDLAVASTDSGIYGVEHNFAVGMATEDIANNALGYITTMGAVSNLNTSAFSDGVDLWLSHTVSGSVTDVIPPAPYDRIRVGTLQRSHVSLGQIYIHTDPPVHLHDISAVTGSDLATAGQALMKDPNGNNWFVFSSNYTGSFSGSFIGDGTGITGVIPSLVGSTVVSQSMANVSLSGSFNGSFFGKTTRIVSNTYTLASADYRIGVSWTLSSSVDLQLPAISSVGEIEYRIKDEHGNASNNNINLLVNGSDTIDGEFTQSMAVDYMAVSLYNDGVSKWFIE